MKSLPKSIARIRFSWTGGLVLGVVLLLLAAGQAAAFSADEKRLFNVAGYDPAHDEVQALLAKGVSPNVPVGFSLQRTAIHVAAEQGALRNLTAMLQAGGNPNLLDGEGNTALHWAATGSTVNHPAVIRLLVQHQADLHRTNQNGATPLHVAVGSRGSAGIVGNDVVKALLDAGAKPERVGGNGLTVLQRFARDGADEGRIVTLLLKAGANPDRKTPGGATPLHLAVKAGSGKPEVVEALLDGGAEACVEDAEGSTPYHLSYEMTRIRQALDRVHGYDASYAGASGCQFYYGGESTNQVEAEQESDDSSEMGYDGAWRALEKRAAEQQAEAARQAENAHRAKAARKAEEERRAAAAWRETQARWAAQQAEREAAQKKEFEQMQEEIQRRAAEAAERQRRMVEQLLESMAADRLRKEREERSVDYYDPPCPGCAVQ